MARKKKYDDSNIDSIIEYANKLLKVKKISKIIGKKYIENKMDKGGIGNAIQEEWFGIDRNSEKEPDFKKAGLELKTFAYRDTKNGVSADQRLALSTIDYNEFEEIVEFKKSHLYHKCRMMLYIIYHIKEHVNRIDSDIEYIRKYALDEIVVNDLLRIKKDYEIITKKIREGRAEELSEGDTEYLGAARTGSKDSKPRRCPLNAEALPRRFVFKQSYMTYLLREYIVPGKEFSQKVNSRKKCNSIHFSNRCSFDEWLARKEKRFIGKKISKLIRLKSIRNITEEVIDLQHDKKGYSRLGFAMLGVKSNKDQYLKKTNTVIKTVRIDEKENNIEMISLPNFALSDYRSKWEDSELFSYLSESRFVVLVFVKLRDEYYYTGHVVIKFTPEELELLVKPTWKAFQKRLKKGVEFWLMLDKKNSPIIRNNIDGKKEGQIGLIKEHIRSITYDIAIENITGIDDKANDFIRKHTNKTGRFVLNKEKRDSYGDELPNGDIIPKQSFWFNRDFVLDYIKKRKPELLHVDNK